MARYSLVVKARDSSDTFVVPFGRNTKGAPITKVRLEEIDIFTNSFPDFFSLESFVKEKYHLPFLSCHFQIQYVYGGSVRCLDPFVHNSFLKSCAEYSLKQKKISAKGLLTEEVPYFSNFRKRMFQYMRTKESVFLLKEDISSLVPYGIKKEVEPFFFLDQLTHLSASQALELADIKERILYLLSSYKNIRGMLRWEQLYLSSKLPKPKPIINTSPIDTKNCFIPIGEEEEEDDEFVFYSEKEMEEMTGYEKEAVYRKYR